jgi:ribokinase
MKKAKVVVMGSFVVDLMMRASRLPVPGETVKGSGFYMGAGGKGSNQGVAASLSGSNVTMVTKLGRDDFSHIALNSFKGFDMDTSHILFDDIEPTGAALIMVDEATSINKITVYLGACNHITDSDVEAIRGEIESADVFLTQLETNQSAVIKAIGIAKAAGVTVILNPAPAEKFDEPLYSMVDYFTPNETEAAFFSGIAINTLEDAEKNGQFFIEKGVKNCVFTLGSRGAYLYNNDIKGELFPPFEVKAIDTTGAGDAFNGGFATAIAEGLPIRDAIRFANATASLSVTKLGTAKSMPNREEIVEMLKNGRVKNIL